MKHMMCFLFFACLMSSPLALAAQCPTALENVTYSAAFSFQSSHSGLSATPGGKKLQIKVGTTKSWDAQEYLIAQIVSGKECQAVCHVTKFEKDENQAPIAMDLDCTGVGFHELSTPATLMWRSTLVDNSVLRFGTWLSGYEQATLKIKTDSYSAKRNLAQIE